METFNQAVTTMKRKSIIRTWHRAMPMCLLIAGCCMPMRAADPNTSGEPSVEVIVEKMQAANLRQAETLLSYSGRRVYKVDYRGFPSGRHAEMIVEGTRMVGVGSKYMAALVDFQGRPLDGSKTYRLHLSPNVPVKDFWSVILYDHQTRSMLQNDYSWPAVSSQTRGHKINADGSVDVYFGPKAPAGEENDPASQRSTRTLVRQNLETR